MEKPARDLVLDMLLAVLEEGKFCNTVLNAAFAKYPELQKQTRAFAGRLCVGVVERKPTLDFFIDRFSRVKTAKQKPLIRNLLRMGMYQMLYMDGVPARAAINETVSLTKKRGLTGLSGFVNGVLRAVQRALDEAGSYEALLERETRTLSEQERLAVRYAAPLWLVQQWSTRFPLAVTEQMLSAQLTVSPLSVRCNQSKCKPETLAARLRAEGAVVRQGRYLPEALVLDGIDSLETLPSFREGLFTVQDESSMLVIHAAGLTGGERVLDLCAAPGGKALHAADRLLALGGGSVEARDLTEQKCEKLKENLARCGFSNVNCRVWDACVFDPSWEETADVVLADLPCSGLGVLSRKPDIKYHTNEAAQRALAELQREILTQAVRYVKPNGVLIYSTCTVSLLENEENRAFLCALGLQPESLVGLLLESVCRAYVQVQEQFFGSKRGEPSVDSKMAEQSASSEMAGLAVGDKRTGLLPDNKAEALSADNKAKALSADNKAKALSVDNIAAAETPLLQNTLAEGYLQLLPGLHGTDGFFIARFRKPVSES